MVLDFVKDVDVANERRPFSLCFEVCEVVPFESRKLRDMLMTRVCLGS